MQSTEIQLAGQTVALHPLKGLYWPARRVLVIADTHFGKPATFRHFGVPVPEAATGEDLARLTQLVAATGAQQLVIAGDFWHAREGCDAGTLNQLRAWRDTHPKLRVAVVQGNHDTRAACDVTDLGFEDARDAWLKPPFVIRHHPEPDDRAHVIAGHTHPAVRLAGFAGRHRRAACFRLAPHAVTLPAFSRFTTAHVIRLAADDLAYAVADDELIRIGAGHHTG